MGGDLYGEVIPAERLNAACRIYAPVGSHEDLLPYLVRRLLENGANTSFVNRIVDDAVPIDELIPHPNDVVAAIEPKAHPRIPLPINLYGLDRQNSRGINLAQERELRALIDETAGIRFGQLRAEPLVPGSSSAAAPIAITDPADRRRLVGQWVPADR